MEFGLQFFPDVSPDEKSAQQYWNESLDLCGLCDELGYTHVRTVEHYFEPYGGYSPAPHIFLTAASQRTSRARLITGALVPAFNHPLKVAGEIGMLDAISNGRLDCGFARAFLPHEFQRLERSMDESRARFDEGVSAIRLLLEEENVTFEGQFHRFKNVTSLPRPTQKTPATFLGRRLGNAPIDTSCSIEWIQSYARSLRRTTNPGNRHDVPGRMERGWACGPRKDSSGFSHVLPPGPGGGQTHRRAQCEPLPAVAGRCVGAGCGLGRWSFLQGLSWIRSKQ